MTPQERSIARDLIARAQLEAEHGEYWYWLIEWRNAEMDDHLTHLTEPAEVAT